MRMRAVQEEGGRAVRAGQRDGGVRSGSAGRAGLPGPLCRGGAWRCSIREPGGECCRRCAACRTWRRGAASACGHIDCGGKRGDAHLRTHHRGRRCGIESPRRPAERPGVRSGRRGGRGGERVRAGETIRGEKGTGSVLALGILCAVIVVTAGALAVVGAGAAQARAAAAADLAALAAADGASGRLPGVPCDLAGAVAQANGASLDACEQAGTTVTVTASIPYLGSAASASARAGPPDSG